jgi:hypothetical protein
MNYLTLRNTGAVLLLGSAVTFGQIEPPTPVRPEAPSRPTEGSGGGGSGGGGSARAARSASESQKHAAQAAVSAGHVMTKSQIFEYHDGGRGKASLFIGAQTPDGAKLAETEEDMAVMARILEKAASGHDDRTERAMGIFVRMPGLTPKQNLYIDGYGAIFFLEVSYPLTPSAVKKETTDGREEDRSEWEEAKQELARPTANPVPFDWDFPGAAGPGEDYKQEKVDGLKQRIVAALANAAHLRPLAAQESVTVVVTGANSANGGKHGRSITPKGTKPAPGVSMEDHASHLVLKVTKSDIEAFSKHEFFAEKVSVALY